MQHLTRRRCGPTRRQRTRVIADDVPDAAASSGAVELEPRHVVALAVVLEELVEGVDAWGVGAEERAPRLRTALVVVVAGCAGLEEAQATDAEAVDDPDPVGDRFLR